MAGERAPADNATMIRDQNGKNRPLLRREVDLDVWGARIGIESSGGSGRNH